MAQEAVYLAQVDLNMYVLSILLFLLQSMVKVGTPRLRETPFPTRQVQLYRT